MSSSGRAGDRPASASRSAARRRHCRGTAAATAAAQKTVAGLIASEGIGGGVDEAGDSTNLFDPPFKLSVCWSDLLSGLVEDAELGVSLASETK